MILMAEAARIDDLLQLPRDERARYAKVLIDSLDDAGDEGWQDAWIEELERRALEARSNPEALENWSVVRKRLRARLRDRTR